MSGNGLLLCQTVPVWSVNNVADRRLPDTRRSTEHRRAIYELGLNGGFPEALRRRRGFVLD